MNSATSCGGTTCTIILLKAFKTFRLYTLFVVIGVSGTGLKGFGQDTLDLFPDSPGALIAWQESLSQPRTLKVFFIRVDLTNPHLRVVTIPGRDPDGEGPAESELTPPLDLFQQSGALAAINTNAFAGIRNDGSAGIGWYAGRPVDIQGMAVSGGRIISPVQEGRTAFWLDRDGRPHIGNPASGDPVQEAVSDWGSVLIERGVILPDSTVRSVHPRTAV